MIIYSSSPHNGFNLKTAGRTTDVCEGGGTGRRARLRCVWFILGGSNPLLRTMTNVLTAFSCQRTFVIFYLLNSDITRGVVHNYAFSCIHRHIGCRQRKGTWNLDGAHAVVVNAEPLLPYTVDLFCIMAVRSVLDMETFFPIRISNSRTSPK